MQRNKRRKIEPPTFTPAQVVSHATYGLGKIINRWGGLVISDPDYPKRKPIGVDCQDIYDAVFEDADGWQFIHSARKEHFRPV